MLKGNPLDEPVITVWETRYLPEAAFPSGLARRTTSRSASPSEPIPPGS